MTADIAVAAYDARTRAARWERRLGPTVGPGAYYIVMSDVTQIAFQIDNESLAVLDEVAEHEAQPRAQVLRTAVREFLMRKREEEIEARLIAGYADHPPGAEEDAFAEVSVEGLQAARLDW